MRSPLGHLPGHSPCPGPFPCRVPATPGFEVYLRRVAAAPPCGSEVPVLGCVAESPPPRCPDSYQEQLLTLPSESFTPFLLGIHIYVYFDGGGRAAQSLV